MTGTKLGKRDIAVFFASPGGPVPERQQFRETIETLDGVIGRVMTGGFNAGKKNH